MTSYGLSSILLEFPLVILHIINKKHTEIKITVMLKESGLLMNQCERNERGLYIMGIR